MAGVSTFTRGVATVHGGRRPELAAGRSLFHAPRLDLEPHLRQ
jgi:hypothetical protein